MPLETKEDPGGQAGVEKQSRHQATQRFNDTRRRQSTYGEHFRFRVLLDAMSSVIPSQWERRAAALEAALPRPGDYLGRSTPEEREERTQRLLDAIAACRRHAQVMSDRDAVAIYAEEIASVLREAS